jgi:exopolysaccharide production protein ExoY
MSAVEFDRSSTVPRPRARPWDGHDAACRAFDLTVAGVALLFLAPLMLCLALLIFLQDGHSPLYRQRRLGRYGRSFPCLKFRSMAPDAEERLAECIASNAAARAEWEQTHKLRHDPRVTRLGRFIRRSSLDELPQLFNVLSGDMSIVGPRPIVQAEVVRYGRHFRRYCAVRPGITGLWQVSGRNDTSYRRRVVMDVAYSRAKRVTFDARIVVATVPAVLLRRGSY